MLLASLPANLAQAAMVTTDQVIEVSASTENRARIMDFMAREDVRQKLQALGVDPDEPSRRAANLSDREIRQIAADLFAAGSGKFVCASAGHHLESALAAQGSGAVALSRRHGNVILNIDIGGGTTK